MSSVIMDKDEFVLKTASSSRFYYVAERFLLVILSFSSIYLCIKLSPAHQMLITVSFGQNSSL